MAESDGNGLRPGNCYVVWKFAEGHEVDGEYLYCERWTRCLVSVCEGFKTM